MSDLVLLPADNEPRSGIPKGAALLRTRHGALIYHQPAVSFAECCARALTGQGRLVRIDFDTVQVGLYDEHDGELRPDRHAGIKRLERWTGRRFTRRELVADNNRADRRADARRLAQQGRWAEAFERDRRMGF